MPVYPGIEISWSYLLHETYAKKADGQEIPFRINPVLIRPGDLNAYLSCPWQSDFYLCRNHWWPACRPDAIVPRREYERVMKLAKKARYRFFFISYVPLWPAPLPAPLCLLSCLPVLLFAPPSSLPLPLPPLASLSFPLLPLPPLCLLLLLLASLCPSLASSFRLPCRSPKIHFANFNRSPTIAPDSLVQRQPWERGLRPQHGDVFPGRKNRKNSELIFFFQISRCTQTST
jgi:hypothetical protein